MVKLITSSQMRFIFHKHRKTFLFFPFLLLLLSIHQPSYSLAQGTSYTITPVTFNENHQWSNGNASSLAASDDGRFLAFLSNATNLVDNTTTPINQVYLYDSLKQKLSLLSIDSFGNPGNAPSLATTISGNGRFVVFETLANNLVIEDKDTTSDWFIYDQVTHKIEPLYLGYKGEKQNARITKLTISGNGRYISFVSSSDNIVLGDDNKIEDAFLYDRFLHVAIRIPLPDDIIASPYSIFDVKINNKGDKVFLLLSQKDKDKRNQITLVLFNRILQTSETILTKLLGKSPNTLLGSITLSHHGNLLSINLFNGNNDSVENILFYLDNHATEEFSELKSINNIFLCSKGDKFVFIQKNEGNQDLGIFNIDQKKHSIIKNNIENPTLAVCSADGDVVAYLDSHAGYQQVYLAQNPDTYPQQIRVQGQVLNQNQSPLALVSIKSNDGYLYKTDPQGFFYLPLQISNQKKIFAIAKEGYTFVPPSFEIVPTNDTNNLTSQATPDKVIEEAKQDIGMPYDYYRGCTSPFLGCGGHYHGFYAGYCTDLILDAYTWGANFSINDALQNEARLHPEHFYRWQNARNAHDMWRYFSYTNQLLPNTEPYILGDIVFFDWDEDGEIDHVSIVSETTLLHTPKKLIDATGITRSNPSGVTSELPWESFHNKTVRGHARWNGTYIPKITFLKQPQSILHIVLSSPQAKLTVQNSNNDGRLEKISGNNVAIMHTLEWETSVSILEPNVPSNSYFLEISTQNNTKNVTSFILYIRLKQAGSQTKQFEFRGELTNNISLYYSIYFQKNNTESYNLIAIPYKKLRFLPKLIR